jgi:Bacterial Ig-like domain (group 2)
MRIISLGRAVAVAALGMLLDTGCAAAPLSGIDGQGDSTSTRTGAVASVSLQPTSASLLIGQTVQLIAVLKDTAGRVLTGRTITWSSGNQLIASVTAAGVVSALAAGSVTISATSEGSSGSATLTVSAPTSQATDPELPRVTIDTRYAAPTGRTLSVAAGGSVQAAIDSAKACDVIMLQAGATFTGPITLRNKSGTCWITIRSSAPDASLPAEGTRMTPSYAGVLAKIVSANSGPALQTEPGAHHYRIIGVELAVSTSVTLNYGIVALGDGSSAQNSLSQVPNNLILDRVYVHGHPTLNVSRCVALNSAMTAVIDSYLSECHAQGFDSQAICGWNGPGPFKIADNYLEGAGEIVMFGGADPAIQNLHPADIEIRRNHVTRPPSWKGVWEVKNLLELKHAQRVLVEGNVFENHWADAQDGFAFVFWSVDQGGTAPWSETRDITFRYNTLRNAGGGMNLAARSQSSPAVPASHMKISDNVFDSIGVGVFAGHGRLFQLLNELDNIDIEHNTTFTSGSAALFLGALPQVTNFVYRNNLTNHGQYGVFGSNVGEGTPALTTYIAPGYVFLDNVIVGVPSGVSYPSGNFFPSAVANVGLADYAGGNYRLLNTSPYTKKGTDGRDPGADIDAVTLATQGVVLP